ncbi:hypothetical protein E2C01_010047 [Portunus trituberculatus]|uniref:Uncharacterized protein n=1 Tax=Portunus trituberculatus TaxID=210409 RepID=A0A5B7D7E7_PORTR|nr:hypothetical protein [Portunus trituberculatus]
MHVKGGLEVVAEATLYQGTICNHPRCLTSAIHAHDTEEVTKIKSSSCVAFNGQSTGALGGIGKLSLIKVSQDARVTQVTKSA